MGDPFVPTAGSALHAATRTLGAVLALVAWLPMFGLIDLATIAGWVDPRYLWPVPLEVSWGSLFTFFIGGAYLWAAIFPLSARLAALVLGIVAVSLLVASAVGLDGRPLWVAAAVAASALLLAWLGGGSVRMRVPSLSLNAPYLAGAAVGTGLWVPYSLTAWTQSRSGVVGDITNGIEHWTVQGALGLTILLGTVVMGLWTHPHHIIRVGVCLSAALTGAAGLAYPDREGAMPLHWNLAAILWAVLLALSAPSKQVGTERGAFV